MERETRMLLWALFGIGVLTVAFLPAAWTSLNHNASTGVQSNAKMAQVLWGQSPSVTPYVSGWAKDTSVPIIPGAVHPHITSVSWKTSTWSPQLVISGYGFGNPPAFGNASITIADATRGWVAGDASQYGVHSIVSLWRNDRIEISGFDGYGESDVSHWSDGNGSWVFAPGDALTIQVTNPQTGDTGSDHVTYPQSAPLPSLTLNPIADLAAGAQTAFTGQVTFAGQPLANQAVNVSVTTGKLGGTAYTDNPNEHVVYTDPTGHFSIPYSANTSGTVSVTVMADGVTEQRTFTVENPNLVLQVDVPTPNLSLPSGAVNAWNGDVTDFPFYAFSQLPINMSFPYPAQAVFGNLHTLWNPDSTMDFWVGQNPDFPNGVQFDHTTVTVPNSETAQISLPDAASDGWVDDFQVIYVNGKPVAMSNGSYGASASEFAGVPMFSSSTDQIPIQLEPGQNDVVIEGLNTDGFSGAGMQPAFLDLKMTDPSGKVLTSTADASKWQSTGYIGSTPSSWNTAATEFILQEGSTQTVYQQETSSALVGQSYQIQGRLTSDGNPVANQTVRLTATGGTIQPGVVQTDASGNFSATLTAPGTPGTYKITATGAGASAMTTVPVVSNQLVSGPIMNGMPSQWSGDWASHMYLTHLPQNAQILASNGSQPTAAYFRYGDGQVLVDTQTVEFYYGNHNWATTEWNNIIHDFLEPAKKPILLLYDGVNWGSNAQAVNAIKQAIPIATMSTLSTPNIPDMNQYGTIVVDAVQAGWFEQNLEQVMPQINTWIQNGGTLIFDSTDQQNIQWSVGPDGISSAWDLSSENDLVGNLQ
ncbi:Ig-like domain-containing protein [Alicyclobacillus curvatus]|nr:Ig-like domain-containing protein [Alicyclobacillus curvatus]